MQKQLTSEENRMKKILLVFLLFMCVVAISNPSFPDHKDAIIKKYKTQNPLTGSLGFGTLLAELVVYQNYIIFSPTTLSNKEITIGCLGQILVQSLDIEEIGEKALDRAKRALNEELQ